MCHPNMAFMTYLTINTTMIITNAKRIIPAKTPPNKEPESTSLLRCAVSDTETEKYKPELVTNCHRGRHAINNQA